MFERRFEGDEGLEGLSGICIDSVEEASNFPVFLGVLRNIAEG